MDAVYANRRDHTPADQLFQQYLLMSLYVEIEDLHRFAGKNGDIEAREAYQRLEPWCLQKDGRYAAWHAGQILRAARLVAPYQFRGFDSIKVYHATLVLWVYGVLKSAEERCKARINLDRSRGSTAAPEAFLNTTRTLRPVPATGLLSDPTPVLLDDQETESLLLWREVGRGRPGIRLAGYPEEQQTVTNVSKESQEEGPFCDLRKSSLVMGTGSRILEQNYPDVVSRTPGNLPPLVENLRDLMRELGRLPGHTEFTG